MARISGGPFWSADSKWVIFPVADQLRKLRVPDGAPEAIAEHIVYLRGGSSSDDGTILIAATDTGEVSLYVLPPGGALTRVAAPGLKDGSFLYPEFLPNSSEFLFAFRPDGALEVEIFLATLQHGNVINPARLMQNPTAVHFTPAGGGRILFVRNNDLYSQRFNVKDRKLEGDAELVQEGVATARSAFPEFSVSRSGVIAWRPGTQALSQVTVFDRQGRQVGTFGPPSDFFDIRLSPDETHLLATPDDGGPQLLERDRPGLFGLGTTAWRVWSPDGTRLMGAHGSQIVSRSVSSEGDTRTLADAPGINRFLEDISPDGKVALYSTYSRSVLSVRLDGSRGSRPTPVIKTGEQILNERFSPDGRWIIYSARTMEGDRLGIFVQPFPGPGLRRQISSTGAFPVWRRDGKEIIFIDRKSNQISAISVSSLNGELRFGSSIPLFAVPTALDLLAAFNPLAVTRDGSQILFPLALAQPEDSNVIHIKSGWLETQH
jgi:Tol biopolymer transport system component